MGKIKVDENNRVVLNVPWVLKRNGKRVMIIVPGMDLDDFKNEGLARQVIKAYQCTKLMESGKFDTVLELANALKIDRSPLARTLSLANLAPDVVNAIFTGTAPEDLTFNKLVKGFPDDWIEQKKVFGIE